MCHVPHTAQIASIAAWNTNSHHKHCVLMELTVVQGFILNKCQQPLELCHLCCFCHFSASWLRSNAVLLFLWNHPLSAPWAVSPRLAKLQAQRAFSKQFLSCQRAAESTFVMWPYSCQCPGHTRQHVPSSCLRAYMFRCHHYSTTLPRTPSPNTCPDAELISPSHPAPVKENGCNSETAQDTCITGSE